MTTRPPRARARSGRDSAPALVAVTTAAGAVRAATAQNVPGEAPQNVTVAASPGPVVGSVCTGYLGLDLGVLAALGGGRIAWCADPDPHIAQILATRLPGVPNLGDVRAIDWTAVEPVDVLTAGFPCLNVKLGSRGWSPECAVGLVDDVEQCAPQGTRVPARVAPRCCQPRKHGTATAVGRRARNGGAPKDTKSACTTPSTI